MRREYVVPLRRGYANTERHQRSKKAVTTLRGFLEQHMKAENIKIGKHLNEHLWSCGGRKPPAKVKIICEKDEEGVVYAELQGHKLPSELPKKEDKKEEKKASKKKEEEAEKAPVRKEPEKASGEQEQKES